MIQGLSPLEDYIKWIVTLVTHHRLLHRYNSSSNTGTTRAQKISLLGAWFIYRIIWFNLWISI